MPARERTRRNQICEIQALVLRRGGRVNPVNPVRKVRPKGAKLLDQGD